jgi:hypothetical protein
LPPSLTRPAARALEKSGQRETSEHCPSEEYCRLGARKAADLFYEIVNAPVPQRLCDVLELRSRFVHVVRDLGHPSFECARRPVNGSGDVAEPIGTHLLLLMSNSARVSFGGFCRISNVRFRLVAERRDVLCYSSRGVWFARVYVSHALFLEFHGASTLFFHQMFSFIRCFELRKFRLDKRLGGTLIPFARHFLTKDRLLNPLQSYCPSKT